MKRFEVQRVKLEQTPRQRATDMARGGQAAKNRRDAWQDLYAACICGPSPETRRTQPAHDSGHVDLRRGPTRTPQDLPTSGAISYPTRQERTVAYRDN